jgi:hypothetical protein
MQGMFLFLLLQSALAGELVFSEAVDGSIEDVVASPEGSTVALISDSKLYLLSTTDWEISSLSPCGDAESVAGAAYDDEGILYVGCSDGSIASVEDGSLTQNAYAVDAQGILSISEKDGDLFVLAENESGGNPRLHAVDIATGKENASAYPATLGYSSFSDAEVVGNYLVVSHGSSSLSKVDLSSGSPTRDEDGPTAVQFSDVLSDPTASNALVAAGSGGVILFQTSSNDTLYSLSGNWLSTVSALAAGDGLLWIADSGSDSIKSVYYTLGSSSPGSDLQEEIALDLSSDVNEMAYADGHLVLGFENGTIGIVTDHPWVSILSVSPSSAVQGDVVDLSFSSSAAGSYEIRLNGTSDSTGTLIDSGVLEAEEEATVSIEVDSRFVEGANPLRVIVDDGLAGHDVANLTVDNPPDAPSLTEDDAEFGSARITLSFPRLEDADISHYQVYLSVEEFSAEDFETGGPDFDEISAEDLQIPADLESDPRITLTPLTNDTRYYIAVRAFDEGGKESPMSNVISATPRRTISASELAGEEGGHCSSVPGGGLLALSISGLLVTLRRRRAGAGIALSLLFCPGLGHAANSFSEYHGDREGGMFEIRYGPLDFDSEVINTVFSETGNQALFVDTGISMWRVLDVYVGMGFIQEMGWLPSVEGVEVDEDGNDVYVTGDLSGEHDMLTILPLSFNAAIRGDLWEGQVAVPSASFGKDYWIWRENWAENASVGGETKVSGGKEGLHYAYGLQILLDRFDAAAASRLETRFGIEDTYIVIEKRMQSIGSDGLIFDGESTTFGLRFQH